MSLTTTGDVLHEMTKTEHVCAAVHERIPRMSDEELVATYHQAGELGKRWWLVQAHCLYEASQRKRHIRDPERANLARMFGITPQYAGKLCGAWLAVPSETRVSDTDLPLSKSFYVAAGQTDAPQNWVAHAEDQKAANPRYSVRDFKADIEQDGRLFEVPREPGPLVTALADDLAADGAFTDSVLLEQYQATVVALLKAAERGRDLVRHWEPEEIAQRLGEEQAGSEDLYLPLVEWIRRVVEARRNVITLRRVK